MGTGVAAVAAAKFSVMLRAAPMLAAAAILHFYRLLRLMSESKFSELLHGALDSRSLTAMPSLRQTVVSNHFTFGASSTSEPAITATGEGMVLINRRHQRPAEGPRR